MNFTKEFSPQSIHGVAKLAPQRSEADGEHSEDCSSEHADERPNLWLCQRDHLLIVSCLHQSGKRIRKITA